MAGGLTGLAALASSESGWTTDVDELAKVVWTGEFKTPAMTSLATALAEATYGIRE